MKTSSILKLVMLVGAIGVAQAEDDMDHGLDWEFSQEEERQMAVPEPETPTKEEESAFIDEPIIIEPVDIPDADNSVGWLIYLQYLEWYKHEIYVYFIDFLHWVNYIFVTLDHDSARNQKEAFRYGLQDGLFKLQRRAHSNCFTDGEQYFWGLYYLASQTIHAGKIEPQEQFTLEDLSQGFMHKCTLQDTLPGTVLLNGAMYGIDMLPYEYQSYFSKSRMVMRLTDLWGGLAAVSELAYFFNVALYKTDGFTMGKIVGKLIKMYIQFKLFYYTSSQNYLIDDSAAQDQAVNAAEDQIVDDAEGQTVDL